MNGTGMNDEKLSTGLPAAPAGLEITKVSDFCATVFSRHSLGHFGTGKLVVLFRSGRCSNFSLMMLGEAGKCPGTVYHVVYRRQRRRKLSHALLSVTIHPLNCRAAFQAQCEISPEFCWSNN